MRALSGKSISAAARFVALLLAFWSGLAAVHGQSATIAQSYLYLEPFSARVEVLLDLPTMLGRLGINHGMDVALTAEDQSQIKSAAAGMAKDWCQIKTDGEGVGGELSAVAFVKGEPGKTVPFKEGEPLVPKDLMLGLIWEFSIGGNPKHVEVYWTGFADPVVAMPLTVFVGNSVENLELRKGLGIARWTNDKGRFPAPTPLAKMPVLAVADVYAVPAAMIVWLLLGLAIYVWMEVKRFKFPGGFVPFLAAWALGIVISYNLGVILVTDPFAPKVPPVSDKAEAEKVLQPLLRNVYRAFDYRKESEIYDRLARSIDGELLRTLYLQTIKALTLEGQEGTRAKVNDLAVTVEKVTPQPTGFLAECQWTALGTVGHWGHQHQRANRYTARLTVVPVGEEWKVRSMEVLEERRL